MVRIAAINYLNTIPFIYGLETRMAPGEIVMQFCTPSVSAMLLREGKADIGIMPVGALGDLKNPSIVNIKNYFNKWYVPNNCAICMAGDFNPDETIADGLKKLNKAIQNCSDLSYYFFSIFPEVFSVAWV